MDSNKLFIFELYTCPHCGMDGTLSLFQAIGKPTRIACKFCYKPVYDLEIKETYFDQSNIRESFIKLNERLKREREHKKKMEELKELKDKQNNTTLQGETN